MLPIALHVRENACEVAGQTLRELTVLTVVYKKHEEPGFFPLVKVKSLSFSALLSQTIVVEYFFLCFCLSTSHFFTWYFTFLALFYKAIVKCMIVEVFFERNVLTNLSLKARLLPIQGQSSRQVLKTSRGGDPTASQHNLF